MPDPKTVFISNLSQSIDYSLAESFGTLRPITSGNYPIYKTARLADEIVAALMSSNKDDYLLLSGSSVVAGICMSVWLELHGEVHLLLWDPSQPAYVTRHIKRAEIRLNIERRVNEERKGGDGRLVR